MLTAAAAKAHLKLPEVDLGVVFYTVKRVENGMVVAELTTKGKESKACLTCGDDMHDLYEQLLTKGRGAFLL